VNLRLVNFRRPQWTRPTPAQPAVSTRSFQRTCVSRPSEVSNEPRHPVCPLDALARPRSLSIRSTIGHGHPPQYPSHRSPSDILRSLKPRPRKQLLDTQEMVNADLIPRMDDSPVAKGQSDVPPVAILTLKGPGAIIENVRPSGRHPSTTARTVGVRCFPGRRSLVLVLGTLTNLSPTVVDRRPGRDVPISKGLEQHVRSLLSYVWTSPTKVHEHAPNLSCFSLRQPTHSHSLARIRCTAASSIASVLSPMLLLLNVPDASIWRLIPHCCETMSSLGLVACESRPSQRSSPGSFYQRGSRVTRNAGLIAISRDPWPFPLRQWDAWPLAFTAHSSRLLFSFHVTGSSAPGLSSFQDGNCPST